MTKSEHQAYTSNDAISISQIRSSRGLNGNSPLHHSFYSLSPNPKASLTDAYFMPCHNFNYLFNPLSYARHMQLFACFLLLSVCHISDAFLPLKLTSLQLGTRERQHRLHDVFADPNFNLAAGSAVVGTILGYLESHRRTILSLHVCAALCIT